MRHSLLTSRFLTYWPTNCSIQRNGITIAAWCITCYLLLSKVLDKHWTYDDMPWDSVQLRHCFFVMSSRIVNNTQKKPKNGSDNLFSVYRLSISPSFIALFRVRFSKYAWQFDMRSHNLVMSVIISIVRRWHMRRRSRSPTCTMSHNHNSIREG